MQLERNSKCCRYLGENIVPYEIVPSVTECKAVQCIDGHIEDIRSNQCCYFGNNTTIPKDSQVALQSNPCQVIKCSKYGMVSIVKNDKCCSWNGELYPSGKMLQSGSKCNEIVCSEGRVTRRLVNDCCKTNNASLKDGESIDISPCMKQLCVSGQMKQLKKPECCGDRPPYLRPGETTFAINPCIIMVCNKAGRLEERKTPDCCTSNDALYSHNAPMHTSQFCEKKICRNGTADVSLDDKCCTSKGRVYRDGQIISDEVKPCVKLVCEKGKEVRKPIQSCCHHLNSSYTSGTTFTVDGCSYKLCQQGTLVSRPDMTCCYLNGVKMESGESKVDPSDKCTIYHCSAGATQWKPVSTCCNVGNTTIVSGTEIPIPGTCLYEVCHKGLLINRTRINCCPYQGNEYSKGAVLPLGECQEQICEGNVFKSRNKSECCLSPLYGHVRHGWTNMTSKCVRITCQNGVIHQEKELTCCKVNGTYLVDGETVRNPIMPVTYGRCERGQYIIDYTGCIAGSGWMKHNTTTPSDQPCKINQCMFGKLTTTDDISCCMYDGNLYSDNTEIPAYKKCYRVSCDSGIVRSVLHKSCCKIGNTTIVEDNETIENPKNPTLYITCKAGAIAGGIRGCNYKKTILLVGQSVPTDDPCVDKYCNNKGMMALQAKSACCKYNHQYFPNNAEIPSNAKCIRKKCNYGRIVDEMLPSCCEYNSNYYSNGEITPHPKKAAMGLKCFRGSGMVSVATGCLYLGTVVDINKTITTAEECVSMKCIDGKFVNITQESCCLVNGKRYPHESSLPSPRKCHKLHCDMAAVKERRDPNCCNNRGELLLPDAILPDVYNSSQAFRCVKGNLEPFATVCSRNGRKDPHGFEFSYGQVCKIIKCHYGDYVNETDPSCCIWHGELFTHTSTVYPPPAKCKIGICYAGNVHEWDDMTCCKQNGVLLSPTDAMQHPTNDSLEVVCRNRKMEVQLKGCRYKGNFLINGQLKKELCEDISCNDKKITTRVDPSCCQSDGQYFPEESSKQDQNGTLRECLSGIWVEMKKCEYNGKTFEHNQVIESIHGCLNLICVNGSAAERPVSNCCVFNGSSLANFEIMDHPTNKYKGLLCENGHITEVDTACWSPKTGYVVNEQTIPTDDICIKQLCKRGMFQEERNSQCCDIEGNVINHKDVIQHSYLKDKGWKCERGNASLIDIRCRKMNLSHGELIAHPTKPCTLITCVFGRRVYKIKSSCCKVGSDYYPHLSYLTHATDSNKATKCVNGNLTVVSINCSTSLHPSGTITNGSTIDLDISGCKTNICLNGELKQLIKPSCCKNGSTYYIDEFVGPHPSLPNKYVTCKQGNLTVSDRWCLYRGTHLKNGSSVQYGNHVCIFFKCVYGNLTKLTKTSCCEYNSDWIPDGEVLHITANYSMSLVCKNGVIDYFPTLCIYKGVEYKNGSTVDAGVGDPCDILVCVDGQIKQVTSIQCCRASRSSVNQSTKLIPPGKITILNSTSGEKCENGVLKVVNIFCETSGDKFVHGQSFESQQPCFKKICLYGKLEEKLKSTCCVHGLAYYTNGETIPHPDNSHLGLRCQNGTMSEITIGCEFNNIYQSNGTLTPVPGRPCQLMQCVNRELKPTWNPKCCRITKNSILKNGEVVQIPSSRKKAHLCSNGKLFTITIECEYNGKQWANGSYFPTTGECLQRQCVNGHIVNGYKASCCPLNETTYIMDGLVVPHPANSNLGRKCKHGNLTSIYIHCNNSGSLSPNGTKIPSGDPCKSMMCLNGETDETVDKRCCRYNDSYIRLNATVPHYNDSHLGLLCKPDGLSSVNISCQSQNGSSVPNGTILPSAKCHVKQCFLGQYLDIIKATCCIHNGKFMDDDDILPDNTDRTIGRKCSNGTIEIIDITCVIHGREEENGTESWVTPCKKEVCINGIIQEKTENACCKMNNTLVRSGTIEPDARDSNKGRKCVNGTITTITLSCLYGNGTIKNGSTVTITTEACRILRCHNGHTVIANKSTCCFYNNHWLEDGTFKHDSQNKSLTWVCSNGTLTGNSTGCSFNGSVLANRYAFDIGPCRYGICQIGNIVFRNNTSCCSYDGLLFTSGSFRKDNNNGTMAWRCNNGTFARTFIGCSSNGTNFPNGSMFNTKYPCRKHQCIYGALKDIMVPTCCEHSNTYLQHMKIVNIGYNKALKCVNGSLQPINTSCVYGNKTVDNGAQMQSNNSCEDLHCRNGVLQSVMKRECCSYGNKTVDNEAQMKSNDSCVHLHCRNGVLQSVMNPECCAHGNKTVDNGAQMQSNDSCVHLHCRNGVLQSVMNPECCRTGTAIVANGTTTRINGICRKSVCINGKISKVLRSKWCRLIYSS